MKKQKNVMLEERNQLSDNERIVNRANLRKKKIMRRKIIFFASMGLLVTVIGVLLVIFMFFNVSTITVSGDKIYTDDEIISASEIVIGDNLIFISEDKINEKITSKLPYVGKIEIKRDLPSGIQIIVTKTEPVFAITENGLYTLLNAEGKVLEKNFETVGDNVIFLNVGEITSSEIGKIITVKDSIKLDKALQLYKECLKHKLKDITTLNVSDIYNIILIYQGRITLEMGEIDDKNIEKKVESAKEIIKIQDAENPNYRGTINLTVDGKASWKEEEITTEPPTELSTEPVTENETTTLVDTSQTETTTINSAA